MKKFLGIVLILFFTVTSLSAAQTFQGNVSGSAATLTTPRTIDGISFDGSANIQTAISTKSDYGAGTVAATIHGFTVVGNAYTAAGTYTKVGRLMHINIIISPAGGSTSIASVGDSSYLGLTLPANPARESALSCNGYSNSQSLGVAHITTGGLIFTPTWGAYAAGYIVITGTVEIQ